MFQLSGLAFEIHDSYLNKRAVEKDNEDEKTKLQVKYQNVNPTFVDMMLYSYCYAGLLTGTRIEMNIYTLGLAYNEFGYYEHPAIKNIFSLTKEHF